MNELIKATVFDMDGVIFDTECIYRDAWIETGKEYGLNDVDVIFPSFMGTSSTKIRELFIETYGSKLDYEAYHKDVENRKKSILEERGLMLKPGAKELFEFLKENGIPAAVATSTNYEKANGYFEKAGIKKYFDCIITGSDITVGKPNPEIYLKACDRLNVSPENAIGIEDSFNGIRAVYNAGMMAVMVPDLLEPNEEISKLLFRKCKSLFEVIDLIKGI